VILLTTAHSTRILLIQLYGLGDVVLLTPAIRVLRERFPGARLDFLTEDPGADVLATNPHLDEILLFPRSGEPRWPLLRSIRRRRYDAVIDFRSTPRTAAVVAMSGSRIRSGQRGRGPRNLLYTHLVPKRPPLELYMAQRNFQLLEPLGVRPRADTSFSPEITLTDADREWAAAFWRQAAFEPGRPVVAVSVVSSYAYKNWGAERWAVVADALGDAGAQLLFTHGPGEQPQVQAVLARMRQRPLVVGDFPSIRSMAALVAHCTLWIGNDGGSKHVATAAGVPTVTVFRWQQGRNWTDTSPGSPHVALETAPPQGCDLVCTVCPHLGCLTALDADVVTRAALGSLGLRPAGI
jgi:ADP-heptose:LPS heptosyltransferase